ncbi:uncharacterized protein LOC123313554 [Coccinella septempunctata]|uniref:uncharacterized protein LOC123313554 n=1 Tax=Coccinella septempunctata TaxID=41139 RepID=UPI001D08F5E9|nr:uncharacterized protein LOC123313554 [Coccinella septempunctata]
MSLSKSRHSLDRFRAPTTKCLSEDVGTPTPEKREKESARTFLLPEMCLRSKENSCSASAHLVIRGDNSLQVFRYSSACRRRETASDRLEHPSKEQEMFGGK